MKAKVKKFNSDGYVSRGLFEQVRWEKDVAMQQLEELGVPFGAKVELYARPIGNSFWDDKNGRALCANCGSHPLYDYFGELYFSKFCPYCGSEMKEVIK